MHKRGRQQFESEAAQAAQPLRSARQLRFDGLLLTVLYLLAAWETSAQTQWTAQPGDRRPIRSLPGRQQVVELLPPVFEKLDATPTIQNTEAVNPRRPTVSANSPPQRNRQTIQRPYSPRNCDRRIVPASHAPQPEISPSEFEQDPSDAASRSVAMTQRRTEYSTCDECRATDHCWQLLPDGLLYKSYLAGEKEPRFAAVWLYESGRGWVWETTLGGRVGLVRYGTPGAVNPDGWQIDIEGAAFPRIDPEESSEMDAVDFRAGFVWTWRKGPLAVKAGYYHISSHIGDEYLLRNPTFPRIEYVRDSAILGLRYDLNSALSTYGEVGYAVGHTGGAEPLELQFGLEYSPRVGCGWRGAPFAAINGHLREDFGFGGNLNIVAGRQWRGAESDHLFRAGLMYFNGKSLQYQLFNKHEELLGAGIWFDF